MAKVDRQVRNFDTAIADARKELENVDAWLVAARNDSKRNKTWPTPVICDLIAAVNGLRDGMDAIIRADLNLAAMVKGRTR